MATSNFEVAGVDLDTVFEPIGATTKIANINHSIGDIDLSNYYADATLGAPYGTVNFSASGTDLGQLFAAIGTVGGSSKLLFTWGYGGSGRLGFTTTVYSWTAVAAGGTHTAAIRSDYLLFAWGVGTNGQLGDGTAVTKSSPVQVGSSSWTTVSAGGDFTAVVAISDCGK